MRVDASPKVAVSTSAARRARPRLGEAASEQAGRQITAAQHFLGERNQAQPRSNHQRHQSRTGHAVAVAVHIKPAQAWRRDILKCAVSPADLRHHHLIFRDAGPFRHGWKLSNGTRTVRSAKVARLRVDNSIGVRDAISAGLGIGLLPHLISQPAVKNGALVPLPGRGA